MIISLLAAVLVAAALTTQAAAVTQMTLKMTICNTSDVFPGMIFAEAFQDFGVIFDVTGDGANEIFFGTRRGHSRRFWSFDAFGKSRWVYPPIDQAGLPGDPTQASLIDVNNDGQYEICFAGRGGRLHVLRPDGSILWTWDNPVGKEMIGAPQAYDVDGDGFVEFFIQDNQGFVHRVDHTGKLVWTSSQAGAANPQPVTIADIDRDGRMEILCASQDHYLYCISADTGAEKWRFDLGFKSHLVIVADVNNDGEYEAVVCSEEGTLFGVSFWGTELWRWSTGIEGDWVRQWQPIGDVNKDGRMNMIITALSGNYCLDIAGSKPKVLWMLNVTKLAEQGIIPQRYGGNTAWGGNTLIVDLTGDGKLEVVVRGVGDGNAPIVLDGATGEIIAWYLDDRIKSITGGWFGDLDGDGKSEYAFYGAGFTHEGSQVYVLTLDGKFPAEAAWPTAYCHSALPAKHQLEADWLTLKAAGSSSMWFPIPEFSLASALAGILAGLWARRR